MISDTDLDRLKADNPCAEVAAKYVKLRRGGKGMIGPCVACSTDRQRADATKAEYWAEGWTCAACLTGGDVIQLMACAESLDAKTDFRRIIGLLNGGAALLGEAVVPVDPAERARAESARAAARLEAEVEQNEFRERERGRAWELWQRARPIAGTAAQAYLELRGLDAELVGARLGFDPFARFYVQDKPKPRLIHEGPALMALIQRRGRFLGLHRTFIDLRERKGKAVLTDPKGGDVNAKKVRGGKKGGHIALLGPRDPRELYLGEGIEKVGGVATALRRAGRDISAAAFWTSVDLGNLGGKASHKVPHPFLMNAGGKRPQLVPGPAPDDSTPAIEIPDSVERLVMLGDSTSDRFETECAIVRASVRYARPGRAIVAAWPPAGKDFDDLLREAA